MKVHALTLFAAFTLAQAGALTLAGTVDGPVATQTRLSAWAIGRAGQPAEELSSTPVKGTAFSLDLIKAPDPQNRTVIDNRISWPGLVDFERVSAGAQAAEVRFYTYADQNGSGKHDDSETLQEVRLNVGKELVFVVWASSAVTVSGSKGYEANLQPGWNALEIEVRNTVSVRPLSPGAPLSIHGSR